MYGPAPATDEQPRRPNAAFGSARANLEEDAGAFWGERVPGRNQLSEREVGHRFRAGPSATAREADLVGLREDDTGPLPVRNHDVFRVAGSEGVGRVGQS